MRTVSGPQGPRVLLDGRPVLSLCSDNYLGLADHPRVREAAADAAMRYGVGAGASRLSSGTMRIHRRLEERLAEFLGQETAVLFGSRYLANVGVIPALAGPGEVVLCDAHAHRSIRDGCQLSRAETAVYRHNDLEHLGWMLDTAGDRARLIATDAVFGTDGDAADLEALAELARRHDVQLLVDDSHGIGVAGTGGTGSAAAAGIADEIDVLVGSLGKAFGSYGGFVACDRAMARYLAGAAPTVSDSTALAPPVVAGAMAALGLLRDEPRRAEKAVRNAAALREALTSGGLEPLGAGAAIATVAVAGDRAERAAEDLLAAGILAEALPAPAPGSPSSRLRLTAMASHTRTELREAAGTIAGVVPPELRAAAPVQFASAAAGGGVFDGLAEAA